MPSTMERQKIEMEQNSLLVLPQMHLSQSVRTVTLQDQASDEYFCCLNFKQFVICILFRYFGLCIFLFYWQLKALAVLPACH